MVTPARLPVIIRYLDQEYFRPRFAPRFSPADELVFTILSQNTTDINAGRALESLKKKYPEWEEAARAPVRSIASAIRMSGIAGPKSRYIKETLSELLAEHGDLELGFLKEMGDREALDYLTRFPGVGIKTASCVLMFALGRPVMPVDTHVFRVCKRLDFLPEDATREEAHWILNAIVPEDDRYSFHINLVLHGRKICKAQRPRCGECLIEGLCPGAILEF
ncbi:MAG: endonuclease III [Thermoleophilia bacterium]|nr:endonuclease III [Thermoleophilia bacterium]